MCGRMATLLPPQAMVQLFDAMPANDLPVTPNFNVCPTTQIHVVTATDQRRLVSMRWGFLPHWYKAPNDGPLLINARAETIAQKPAFRAACRERRCLIPTTGFYEWTKDADGARLPWYVTPADDAPMVMAGIWQTWGHGEDAVNTCAVVTTQASGPMADIHHRVPVMIMPDQFGLWLGEQGKGAARLMHAPDDDYLKMHRVSRDVNSNRAEGPDLIEPFEG
ncbi:SOS response-associated peptidase [Nereida sp. MMG025]|uniref:SOS response-associated peptidase n=1 Tax=Nereida sp. MMG025 TaxID=2909981 RepID=UPI001F1C2F3C|nr:SOS response-associated peptidase [Nereida sp. MMG025]MCF6443988.1 SOS response-associated peptidase [Nereida sp. MMG025]